MKAQTLFARAIYLVLFLSRLTWAQCDAPELVRGADKYDELVCKASAMAIKGDDHGALDLWLSAAEQPVLESPNIRLFGRIAKTYARLGRFPEADRYMQYDNLSILWMIGVVRCRAKSKSEAENLFQDGMPLTSDNATHMATVLCGRVFDEYSYFRDRNSESFISAANAILEYASLRKEIDEMRRKPISSLH